LALIRECFGTDLLRTSPEEQPSFVGHAVRFNELPALVLCAVLVGDAVCEPRSSICRRFAVTDLLGVKAACLFAEFHQSVLPPQDDHVGSTVHTRPAATNNQTAKPRQPDATGFERFDTSVVISD
jgi:hypothetical protein